MDPLMHTYKRIHTYVYLHTHNIQMYLYLEYLHDGIINIILRRSNVFQYINFGIHWFIKHFSLKNYQEHNKNNLPNIDFSNYSS